MNFAGELPPVEVSSVHDPTEGLHVVIPTHGSVDIVPLVKAAELVVRIQLNLELEAGLEAFRHMVEELERGKTPAASSQRHFRKGLQNAELLWRTADTVGQAATRKEPKNQALSRTMGPAKETSN